MLNDIFVTMILATIQELLSTYFEFYLIFFQKSPLKERYLKCSFNILLINLKNLVVL